MPRYQQRYFAAGLTRARSGLQSFQSPPLPFGLGWAAFGSHPLSIQKKKNKERKRKKEITVLKVLRFPFHAEVCCMFDSSLGRKPGLVSPRPCSASQAARSLLSIHPIGTVDREEPLTTTITAFWSGSRTYHPQAMGSSYSESHGQNLYLRCVFSSADCFLGGPAPPEHDR